MVTITFPDRATEKRALAFLLGRFSGRVLRTGEQLVPEAALEALADQNIPFTVQAFRKNSTEQPLARYHENMKRTAQTRKTMTLTLQLPPAIEKQLLERAVQAGQSVEGLALKLIEEALGVNGGPPTTPAAKTFAEIFAPVREGFRQSGMTEDDLGALIEQARDEAWREKQARKDS